jgi:hypothetical protein
MNNSWDDLMFDQYERFVNHKREVKPPDESARMKALRQWAKEVEDKSRNNGFEKWLKKL